MWVPNGKVKFFGSKKVVAERPGSMSGGMFLARWAARGTSRMVTALPEGCGCGNDAPGACPTGTTGSGTVAPLALDGQNLPSANETLSHSIRCAASLLAFSFSFWRAI